MTVALLVTPGSTRTATFAPSHGVSVSVWPSNAVYGTRASFVAVQVAVACATPLGTPSKSQEITPTSNASFDDLTSLSFHFLSHPATDSYVCSARQSSSLWPAREH